MNNIQPFQLRDHGNKLLEVIINIKDLPKEHKAVETLVLLCKRLKHVILTLSPQASLSPELEETINSCGELGVLKIVLSDRSQIPFELKNTKVFFNLADAKLRIKGEEILDKILDQMAAIPTLKDTTYTLIEMLHNPDIPFEEVEKVAETDPALVVRMLKSANSAFNMRRNRIETLKMAVTYLGIEGIRQILAAEMFRGFVRFYSSQRDKLIHMRRCSHLSVFLGKQIGLDYLIIAKIKIAALLHDIGSLGLSFYKKADYLKVVNKVRIDKLNTATAETQIFGIEHQEIGSSFAAEIGLPDYIVKAAGFHHNISNENDDDIVLSVIVAANGFLNEYIEQISFTEYESILKDLALKKIEYDKKNKKSKAAKDKENNTEESEALPEPAFNYRQFYALLKESLDELIASGDANV